VAYVVYFNYNFHACLISRTCIRISRWKSSPFVRLSHFAIRPYFKRAITASIISSLWAAANVHARTFSSVSLKFHKAHMPCCSHRGTSFGSVETSLTTQRATRIPLVLTILTFLVSVLKNSSFIRSMCQLRHAVNEERYHARNNKRGNALFVSEKCKFLRAC